RIRHANPVATGPNTQYDFAIYEGFCDPDDAEGDNGDNGPGDAAPISTDGSAQSRNFCADPLDNTLGDQDWVRFSAVAGGTYTIQTSNLGVNSDTVLTLYDANGRTVLQRNDDAGSGGGAMIQFV